MTGPTLRIDLTALDDNMAAVRARIAPARLMLVVKDDAYGHGLERIVTHARQGGVEWFGAFDVTTGAAIRAVTGPGPRIFSWLTVGAVEIVTALEADVDLGVGDLGFLDDIAATARALGACARVHLKIDTGLHRNGIRPEAWAEALQRAKGYSDEGVVAVVGVWSHIAEASDAEDDAARTIFDQAVADAEAAGLPIEVRHLAASAAGFARGEFRYDMVRVGAFCYGIRSADGPSEASLGLRPVASLWAPVVGAEPEGTRVGVGALHGLPSTLGGVTGTGIGSVGTFESVLDTHPEVGVGDVVPVIGVTAPSATDLAEAIGTVGEEILTRVSPLVERVEVS